MSIYADPDSFGSGDNRTDEQLRRDAGLLVIANALAADPDQMAAFTASLGLLARAGSSPANGCEEPSVTAGGRGSAAAPGPA